MYCYFEQITDFGLSKVFESDADAVMKTTYVGTRGYQAPELLLDQPYDLACDIFSAGVVLFILLTGCMCIKHSNIYFMCFFMFLVSMFVNFISILFL